MATIDPVDDIKAGFVVLLEGISDLNGKVFPENNDDYFAAFPSVGINVDEDVRVTTRTPLGKEIILDDSDPDNVIVGRELLNAEYLVNVCIKASSDSEKRSFSGKVLDKVLSVNAGSVSGAPTGFYILPSGAPARIRYMGQYEERKHSEGVDGKDWDKTWIREFTFVVNTILIASDAQGYYMVEQAIIDLYVNPGELSENNGETITIV